MPQDKEIPVDQKTPAAQPSAPHAVPAAAVRRVSSRDLLGEAGELVIVHREREYRLRLTQHGRLILTA
jgi:hemin uptake protein HemP